MHHPLCYSIIHIGQKKIFARISLVFWKMEQTLKNITLSVLQQITKPLARHDFKSQYIWYLKRLCNLIGDLILQSIFLYHMWEQVGSIIYRIGYWLKIIINTWKCISQQILSISSYFCLWCSKRILLKVNILNPINL